MARNTNFRIVIDDMGMCCRYGYLALEDLKAAKTPAGRIMPNLIEQRFGFCRRTACETIRKYRQGFIQCEGQKRCILVKAGLKDEPPPTHTEKTQTWMNLVGQTMPMQRMKEGWPMEPNGEVIDGKVISVSKQDWLWLGVHLDRRTLDIKLGDVLYHSPAIWGTVVDIDGPVYHILLPGNLHGQRNKRIDAAAETTSVNFR